jgi:CubicO group peptidase (beta-lactamase class C family)
LAAGRRSVPIGAYRQDTEEPRLETQKNCPGPAGRRRRGRHGRLVQPGQGNPRPAGRAAHQPRPAVLERAQRDAAFRALDRLPVLAKWRVVEPAAQPSPLPPGPPLKLPLDLDAYMAGQRSAALLIVHNGKLRLERYGLGFDAAGRWTSFSVAKSFTSTLVGAALRDGHIKSMDDKVSDYIPQMKGSAYDAVSIRQLLTMTSGVKWNEDYADPNADVAKFNNHKPDDGVDALVSYLRQLPREVPAGTRWLYSTGETNLVGMLVARP